MEVMERERERARERMLVLVKRKKIAMERAAALAAEDRSIFEKQVACQLLRIEDGIWSMSRRLDKCKHELAIVDPPSSSSHYLYSITPPLEAAPNPSLHLRNPPYLHLCPPNTPFAHAPFTVSSSRRHAGANTSNSISSSSRESRCVTVACEIPVTAQSESSVSTPHTNVICEGPENVEMPEEEVEDWSSGISEEEAAARVVEEEEELVDGEAAAEEESKEIAKREVEVVEVVEEEAAAQQAFAQLLHSLCSVRIASPARGLETMTST